MNWTELLHRSYVPYSDQPAACMVIGESGRHYPGVRIENIAFPDTIHEYQAALFACLTRGDRPVKLLIPPDLATNDDVHSFWVNEYGLKVIKQVYPEAETISDFLLPRDTNIPETLAQLLNQSVVTFSHFPVSSLVETSRGFISGVNVECSEWRWGLCAERVALSTALSLGISDLESIHIHAAHGDYNSPCGACRQVLLEHMPDKPVYLYHADQTCSRHLCRHLLPYSFTTGDLKKSGHKEQ